MSSFAFLFSGQGAQKVGMGKDFAETYSVARETFEEADDLLQQNLSKVIFAGPQETLTETKQAQPALFVVGVALLRVVRDLYPDLVPAATAGLSLGEYTALTAAGWLNFADTLSLVSKRGASMHTACEETRGTMAVLPGMSSAEVEELVTSLEGVWPANYNTPNQLVVSATLPGVEALEKKHKVKRLVVHGAFHSPLMESARARLEPYLLQAKITPTQIPLVMNVCADFVHEGEAAKRYLVEQVTHPVRWMQSIERMREKGITRFIELGPGRVLQRINQKIDPTLETLSVGSLENLKQLETWT